MSTFLHKLDEALYRLDEATITELGEVPQGGVGASGLGGQFPGGPDDEPPEQVPQDLERVADTHELETMEKEQNKQQSAMKSAKQDKAAEADRAKWEPLELKFQLAQEKARSAADRALATKKPGDFSNQASLEKQAEADKKAYQRARWPNLPPNDIAAT